MFALPATTSEVVMQSVLSLIVLVGITASAVDRTIVPIVDPDLLHVLRGANITPGQILGIDNSGIPLVCGTSGQTSESLACRAQDNGITVSQDTRTWECIPGVIRDDGVDTFRLEVRVDNEITRVTLDNISFYLIFDGAEPLDLRDDGLGADVVAGDSVFTAGPFRYNTELSMPQHYMHDAASPSGLFNTSVGTIVMEDVLGTATRFLIGPEIGVLRSDIPDADCEILSSDVVASPHLINIQSTSRETQRFLRALGGDLRNLTRRVYEVLPDTIDFFMFISTSRTERLPRTSPANFVAGVHMQTKTDFTGTGRRLFDGTQSYGSNSILLSVNVLDAYSRGLWAGNATHELIHQWSSYTDTSIGLSDGTAHYIARSSAASLVGGFLWTDSGDGTFVLDCDEGRNGAHHAPAIDRYMMGLIDAADVPVLRRNDTIDFATDCGNPVVSALDIVMDDIQSVHGVRTPGPGDAQVDFRIAFIAESHGRLLNSTEMTYYEILADHYTQQLPPSEPDPRVGANWASIDRFFGEDTTWSTVIRVFHDADNDRDVDLDDFVGFDDCFSGPKAGSAPGCEIFDRDRDRDVDFADFQVFQSVFTGPSP